MTPSEDGTDLALRPAIPEDAAPLADLFVAAREAAYPAMPRPVHSADEIHGWFTGLVGSDGTRETWVAEQAGELSGYLVLDPEWLDSLYVRPDLVGRGVGSVLLDLAKSLRPGGFALWVFESNERARRFYARHGLWELERTDGSANEERCPDVRMAWVGERPLDYLRRQINEVDEDLSRLLARRAALTAAAQQHKRVPGHAGRDRGREAEIAARMARHAPALGEARLSRIMDAVITASLDAADEPSPPAADEQGRTGAVG